MNRPVHEFPLARLRLLALLIALPCGAQQPAGSSASDALQKQVARDIAQLASALTQDASQAGVDATQAEALFGAGDFRGAAAAFEQRLASRPEDAALLYNLALSAWRAGDLARAEDAIDRYAAAPGGGRADLHQGMLGNIRYREAEQRLQEAMGSTGNAPLAPRDPQDSAQPKDPLPLLEEGVAKAKAACDAFAKATVDSVPQAGIARNLERALRLQRELEKQLEELKKQREQQQDQKSDDSSEKDGKDKDDSKKDGEQQQKDSKEPSKDDQQKQESKDEGKPDDESKQDESQQQKDGEPGKDGKPERQDRPEPKPDDAAQEPQADPSKDPSAQKPEPKAQPEQGEQPPKQGEEKPEPAAADGKDEQQPDAKDGKRRDAPGEVVEGAQVSPEQRARLMEQLKGLDARMQEIRKATRSKGRPVERDW